MGRNRFQVGDMVYYSHSDANANQTKYAARVMSVESGGLRIRVGRYDVDSREIKTIDSLVSGESLEPRSIPCSYEDELG